MSRLAPLVTPTWPTIYPRSDRFRVTLDEQPVDVLVTASAHFAVVVADGEHTLTIRCPGPVTTATVHPLSRGIAAEVDGERVRVTATMPENLWIEIDDQPPLYLFASPRRDDAPDPDDPAVRYFRGGQVYEADCFELGEGETIYLEHGAVLRGAVRSYGARDIALRGPGIVDGARHVRGADPRYANMVRYEGCQDIAVRDVTLLNPCSWTHVLFGCDRVTIDNVHQIGHGGGNDGIDVMSSRDVTITGGFIHSGDDCIVVKAQSEASSRQRLDGTDRRLAVHGSSERITATGCVLMNGPGGNALEIGHELRCDRVGDIAFRDIDVLGTHGHGATFSIHNCDRAVVEHVRYEDIRVEHHYDKLFSIRITKSRFAHDEAYGRIRDVEFRNLRIAESPFNPGYTCSVIGGHDPEHAVGDLRFVDVRLGDRVLGSLDDFDCYHKHLSGVTFDGTE